MFGIEHEFRAVFTTVRVVGLPCKTAGTIGQRGRKLDDRFGCFGKALSVKAVGKLCWELKRFVIFRFDFFKDFAY